MIDGPDVGVPAHFGSPFAEQRALLEGVGFVDRSHRPILRISGSERLTWLHTLTTQHLEALAPWRGTEALILSPKGHVEHDLWLLDDGESVWLDIEPGTVTELVGHLERMRFRYDVTVDDVSAEWGLASLVGPGATETLSRALGVQAPAEIWGGAPLGQERAGWVRRSPSLGDATQLDLLLRRGELEAVSTALAEAGVAPAGTWAFEALRIAARRPRLGLDTDHRTLVQEVDWVESAVHLKKGCYRGQETVAKVQNLGQRPRRLVLLHLDDASEELPARGDEVQFEGRVVGVVGSSARHVELGAVALALVKRTLDDAAALSIGQANASIDPQ
jgi:folate-binding protein YgfZ